MTEKNNLFESFSVQTNKQWEDAFLKEVKATVLNDCIKEVDGIKHKPYYTINDRPENFNINVLNTQSNNWISDYVIYINKNYKQANQSALYALERGAESITFSGNIDNYENFCTLLNNILIQHIELSFENHFASEQIALWYKKYTEQQSINFSNLNGCIACDPLKSLLVNCNWVHNKETDFSLLGKNIFNPTQKIRTVSIDDYLIHYAGANFIEQTAISLSIAHNYLQELLIKGTDIDTACAQLQINTHVTIDYFSEIARIRAMRFLWSKIIEQYKPIHNCSKNIFIKAITSDFEWTNDDRESNVIRATTQAMSAAIAGCNAISVKPFTYDAEVIKLSTRTAININHILREESFLNKVIDAASGTYYIENYTYQLSEKIWEMFAEIESFGGATNYILNHKLSALFQNRKNILKEKIRTGEKIIVGLNKYPPKTKTPNQLFTLPENTSDQAKIITPLTIFRLQDLYND